MIFDYVNTPTTVLLQGQHGCISPQLERLACGASDDRDSVLVLFPPVDFPPVDMQHTQQPERPWRIFTPTCVRRVMPGTGCVYILTQKRHSRDHLFWSEQRRLWSVMFITLDTTGTTYKFYD